MNRVRQRRVPVVVVAVAAVLAAAATAAFFGLRGEGRVSARGTGRSAGMDVFAALRARPLRVPAVPAKSCTPPIGPDLFVAVGLPHAIPAEGGLGHGPVHPV